MRINSSKLKVAGLITFMAMAMNIFAQCPEITIDQKYDHVPSTSNRFMGWDTVVDCQNRTLLLHATPFITTQHFNGQYSVESIPYNPVDPTFHAGQRLNITRDDQWESSMISFPFTFMFFGYPYTQAVVGSNGIVSFNSSYMGQSCAYQWSGTIPSTSFPSLNAIYGVYEDIDPQYLEDPTTSGMFRSVGGEYPCRYLCASVNGVDLFGNHNHYNSYQIVCYEGTNIIEVHIKQRHCCASTNTSCGGIIGIQNATGANQESHYHQSDYLGQPSFYIQPNSPGAFTAPGRNSWTGSTAYEAWRFTPLGETTKNISWWRLIEDEEGNIIDSVEFSSSPLDTNGIYLDDEHVNVSVSPKVPTRYLCRCVYRGANNYLYGVDGRSMRDTIFVGVDTLADLTLSSVDSVICQGQAATVNMRFPETLVLDSCSWSAAKVENGVLNTLAADCINVNPNLTMATLQPQNRLTPNKIDSVWLYVTAQFQNGCPTYDSFLIRTYPNFNIYDTNGICAGDTYTYCGNTYSTPGDFHIDYHSQPGCDSIHHLHLIVSDVSHTVDFVTDCKPYTWLNGRTYAANNFDTRDQDTVVLLNQWGCDSIVTLDFTYQAMKAIIGHTPEIATLDELTVELNDLSYGHNSHIWLLPNGETATGATTYLNFPLEVDSLTALLAVHNDYGCDDTAKVVIPLKKVAMYAPNIFTPDLPDNNKFSLRYIGNVSDPEVHIFDRRGAFVNSFKGPDGYWDGTAADGTRCQQGGYIYIIRYRDSVNPNETQEIVGTITLVR